MLVDAMLTVTVRLVLLAALPALTGNAGWVAVGEVVNVSGAEAGAGAGAGPVFAVRQQTAVLAAAGQRAELHCRVLRLGDKSVSWVRSRDLQILAYGGTTFTADSRVSAAREQASGASTFALNIDQLRPQDAGRYECQVNTDPKLSLFFNLTVVEEEMPRVVVAAQSAAVRGAAGGVATLACEARYEPPPRALPLPPLALTWRRRGQNAQPLTHSLTHSDVQRVRGGVSLDTERWERTRVQSRLTLSALSAADDAVYECVAGGTFAAVTLLVDDDGEEPVEAMQRDQSAWSQAGAHADELSVLLLTALTVLILR